MKQINIEEIRKLQISILLYVHEFCKKNNIRYSLSGGTLLGAVRHKGYIPWDDDIDIMMPRPDYERFVHEFNKNREDVEFKVVSSYNDSQFFQPFAKVVNTKTFLKETYKRPVAQMGVYIDVFPIDGLPNDEQKREKYWNFIARQKNISTAVYENDSSKEKGIKKSARKFLYLMFSFRKANFYANKLHKYGKKNNFEGSKYIANSIFGYHKKETMPGNLFDSFVELDFEDRKFMAVADWNTYLANLFGDYMKLPPVEQQVSKHDFEAWWRKKLPINIDLPENFLDEEIRCGYTVTKEQKELWAVELDLLVQVQKICEKHDIKYFAYAGTLLGAVRHKGYIPWDDDIDIMMTRENYIKFCKFAEKELKYPYFLQTEKTDPSSILGLAKIRNSKTTGILKAHKNRNFKFNQGIFIDIFPLDNIPDREEDFYKLKKNLMKLYSKFHIFRNRFHCDLNENSVIKKLLSKIPVKNFYYFKYEKECQKYNKIQTIKFAEIFHNPKTTAVFERRLFESGEIELDFEFLKIPVPSKYNEVLTVHFGNWKEYVIGTSEHGELIIDTNKSYKEYIFDKINGRRCT